MCTDVSTTLQAELAKEVTDLRDQLAEANARWTHVRSEQNKLFEAFQEALLDVEDDGNQEVIKDFLEEVTGREFHLTKTFRVEYRVVVTFRAKSQDVAEDVGIDVSEVRFGPDIEDFDVDECEQVSCDVND